MSCRSSNSWLTEKVRFSIVAGAGIPYVQGDIGLIERVFENLIENALRHSYDGGEIALNIAEQNGSVAVKIADKGSGIAKEDLPRIFERFYRGDKSRSSGGAGLGLAITKRIVELHGSRIDVTSAPGEGTCFAFSLPLS
jgi:signal transduction histidine kinase